MSGYVLITPAHNEGGYLRVTAESVLSQVVRPAAWAIVDDGSTDDTWDIVMQTARRCGFVSPVRLKRDGQRSFASKAVAFAAGYRMIRHLQHEFVGNLDADVTLSPYYYEKMLDRFREDPALGIAGGRFYDREGLSLRRVKNSPSSVRGAVQLFRRACFEQIGGYVPFRLGGIDSAAEYKARMHGWTVRTFPDITVIHNRPTGTGDGNQVSAGIRRGEQDYSLGYHPLFELVRCGYRIMEGRRFLPPALVAYGYLQAWVRRQERQVPIDVQRYVRREQRSALIRAGRWS